jgi:addiction module HigA family antidote
MDHHIPPHPGEILREDILPSLDMTRAELAKRLRISTRRLSDLLAERRPIDVDLALRLGAVVGYGARYWLGMQIQHDIWRTENEAPIGLKPLTWSHAARGAGKTAAARSGTVGARAMN